jgi:hypothetical protein
MLRGATELVKKIADQEPEYSSIDQSKDLLQYFHAYCAEGQFTLPALIVPILDQSYIIYDNSENQGSVCSQFYGALKQQDLDKVRLSVTVFIRTHYQIIIEDLYCCILRKVRPTLSNDHQWQLKLLFSLYRLHRPEKIRHDESVLTCEEYGSLQYLTKIGEDMGAAAQ